MSNVLERAGQMIVPMGGLEGRSFGENVELYPIQKRVGSMVDAFAREMGRGSFEAGLTLIPGETIDDRFVEARRYFPVESGLGVPDHTSLAKGFINEVQAERAGGPFEVGDQAYLRWFNATVVDQLTRGENLRASYSSDYKTALKEVASALLAEAFGTHEDQRIQDIFSAIQQGRRSNGRRVEGKWDITLALRDLIANPPTPTPHQTPGQPHAA